MKRIVGFSGGADSQATALWVRQRFPKEEIILLNSDAGGNEDELTTEWIKWYSETIFPVVTVSPIVADMGTRGTKEGLTRDRRQEFNDNDPLTFDRLAYIKGRWPSRKAQFCTEHLKLAPAVRWVKANVHEPFERYAGVRRDESEKRKNTPLMDWDEYFDCIIHYPIADWIKKQVFDFLAEHGEEINPLYKMGFSRVGCAPCINSSKDDVRNWAARRPQNIDKIREWEKRTGRTFFAPCVPGLKINWIDEVVQWSKTPRGDQRMIELPFVEAEAFEGGCSSKYGLCE